MTKRGPAIPVKVTQTVDTFKQLINRLRDVQHGIFIVWIHEHKVAKVAEVSRPEVIERSLEPRDVSIAHEN